MRCASSVGGWLFLMSCTMAASNTVAASNAGAAMDSATEHRAVAAPSIVAVAAGSFEGTYTGQINNVKQASACGSHNSWTGTFVVQDNKFHTNVGKLLFNGDMHPDGSFESSVQIGRSGLIQLVGKIEGIVLQAKVNGPLCDYTMNMRKAQS
jgi:hypothetical protein